MDLKPIAHLGRFRDILLILFKYGFGGLVENLDLPGKDLLRRVHQTRPDLSPWERIRLALEELGPTFVKVGQVLSLRPDLIPVPLLQELSKLQDCVPPESFEHIREVVEKSLKRPLEEVFALFEPEPLAAASLAQVHRARLAGSNQVVAVKVQRPGVRETIDTDLYIMDILARMLEERTDFGRVYDLRNLVRHLRIMLVREIDFQREARNITIARNHLEGMAEYHIPEVYPELTTPLVLTMELIRGVKLRDKPDLTPEERQLIASRGVALTIRQVLHDGFFHADPHPGNFLLMEGNVLCLLDWGMVGRLTTDTRSDLISLMQAIITKDGESILNVLTDMLDGGARIDSRAMEREIMDILDTYHSVSIRHFNMGQFLLDITSLFRQQGVRIPSDLAIMIKALVTAEGTALLIDPELDIIREAEPHVRALGLFRMKTGSAWRSLSRTVSLFLRFQKELPRRVFKIIDKIEHDELAIRFRHENLSELLHTLDSVTNRLVLGIMLGAMVIGSSMIITTGVGPMLWGYPALGVIGYIISGGIALWLVFNILTTRKY